MSTTVNRAKPPKDNKPPKNPKLVSTDKRDNGGPAKAPQQSGQQSTQKKGQ